MHLTNDCLDRPDSLTQLLSAGQADYYCKTPFVPDIKEFAFCDATGNAMLHFAEQFLVPVSATVAIIHFPSTRTRLNRSVPQ